MIVGEQKPFEEIWRMVSRYRSVLVAGCGTCMTVCFAGGEKEVGILASMLRMRAMKEPSGSAARFRGGPGGGEAGSAEQPPGSKEPSRPLEVLEATVKRQCDREFIDELAQKAEQVDAILSVGCGAGIQFVAERFPRKPVLPGVNTRFIGVTPEQGEWLERCAACGDCVLDRTGGICPVARCAKRIHNGPCGGSHGGKCEVAGERDCAWALIVERLKGLDRLSQFEELVPPRDWRANRDGGQRKQEREDLREPSGSAARSRGGPGGGEAGSAEQPPGSKEPRPAPATAAKG